MNSILSNNYHVHFSEEGYGFLSKFLDKKKHIKIFILVDENTEEHCLEIFKQKTDRAIDEVIQVKAGENHKNLQTCTHIWNQITEFGADRKSLLINLGGGVVTDMGGFSASCYKRGIDFINIPTTLLSMVDASVGGKTGVDLGVLKNQIGVFSDPKMVIIDPTYLKTLNKRELKSGMAEVIKHSLIRKSTFAEERFDFESFSEVELIELIHDSIQIKNDVVTQDPKEGGLRKILNFGHTIGHAVESYFLQSNYKETLTHGEAIVVGMICECYLSEKLVGFSTEKSKKVAEKLLDLYPKVNLNQSDFEEIKSYLIHDKKNENGQVNFVLLKDYGVPAIDCKVPVSLIDGSLEYYAQLIGS